jgi:hypothetical protein
MTAPPTMIVRGKRSPEMSFLLTIMSLCGAEGKL